MKAPEKIFRTTTYLNSNRGNTVYKNTPVPGAENIEYINKDVFIEKAEDFINRKICDYIVRYNYGTDNDMETMYVDSRFFDDFKNLINSI